MPYPPRDLRSTVTLTYGVTVTYGLETAKKLAGSVITTKAVDEVIRVGTEVVQSSKRGPSYTLCVPHATDVDCAGCMGDGPADVTGPVIGPDVYDLNRHDNGLADE